MSNYPVMQLIISSAGGRWGVRRRRRRRLGQRDGVNEELLKRDGMGERD